MRGFIKKAENREQTQWQEGMLQPHTSSLDVWHQSLSSKLETAVTQRLQCCGNTEIQCPTGCVTLSLPTAPVQPQSVALQRLEHHRLTFKNMKHETENKHTESQYRYIQSWRILPDVSNRSFCHGYTSHESMLAVGILVRLVYDGKITSLIG